MRRDHHHSFLELAVVTWSNFLCGLWWPRLQLIMILQGSWFGQELEFWTTTWSTTHIFWMAFLWSNSAQVLVRKLPRFLLLSLCRDSRAYSVFSFALLCSPRRDGIVHCQYLRSCERIELLLLQLHAITRFLGVAVFLLHTLLTNLDSMFVYNVFLLVLKAY